MTLGSDLTELKNRLAGLSRGAFVSEGPALVAEALGVSPDAVRVVKAAAGFRPKLQVRFGAPGEDATVVLVRFMYWGSEG